MILVGSIRYRLPLEPFLIIFAAAAFVHLSKRCIIAVVGANSGWTN